MVNKKGDVIKHKKLGRGEWVVVATAMTGGGTAHGRYDRYPDGHQITCKKLIKGTDQIDWEAKDKEFYQSGCFIDEYMLPFVESLRKLK